MAVKLLTTDLLQSRIDPDIYYERDIKTQRLLRVGRCVDRYIWDGKYIRYCAPVLNILNNKSAKIINYKNK